ncbi:UDP-galactopyranose mutase [Alicyclobacillus fodiniaquatilis]|jgi:UDP-galactopyranose mutase|uniref:UDP-galactopyranose mutase n=1 Tax=Alicyclobacillus fodiniaquatilis TaxID=1661150 RepID=A0ABW4JGJ7_9BACL
MDFKYIVVGAGFSGIVMAERISTVLGERTILLEQRNHIGGNAYDYYDEYGNLIHKYGPHIFHTTLPVVWNYLSQFTDWIPYEHKVLGSIDGQLMPIPFNLNSLHLAFPSKMAMRLEDKLIDGYGYNVKVPILKLRNNDDPELQFLADYIYEKVFLNYTIKQWGVSPEELSPSVTARVPVYVSRDDRYFQDKYQAMPRHGYTQMFENMLNSKLIHLMLNTDYKDVLSVDLETGEITFLGQPFDGKLIYTGPLDYFFDFKYGPLPYRSLRFEFENHATNSYQRVGTVNYPCDYDYTRVTEFKHLTHQQSQSTTIVREYPEPYEREKNLPYYPIKNDANAELLGLYHADARRLSNVFFLGRLAEYQYYNMDAVVSKALKVFSQNVCGGPQDT